MSAFNYAASVEWASLALARWSRASWPTVWPRNRIRPSSSATASGNYEDWLQRDDVRYIRRRFAVGGYESAGFDMIQVLLDHYPNRQVVATFVVNETGPADRAVLIDKVPGSHPRAPD
jgi:hypothetical protein